MGQTFGTFNGGLSSGGGTAVAAGINALYGAWQQHYAAEQADWDRAENYRYNELAAENADARTRALYNDFYSPKALLRQYKAAGLSPSMMFGGTPGQGGISGAQGTGAHGPQTMFSPSSLVDAAQAAALFSQAIKTKAETKNIEQDTINKELQEEWQKMVNEEHKPQYLLTTAWFQYPDGTESSLYDIANLSDNYEEFTKRVNESFKGQSKYMEAISSEQGQKTLRSIYYNANKLENDIQILTTEKVSLKFQENLMKELSNKNIEQEQAETLLKQLKTAQEGADLTIEQKGSWNRIIDNLRRKNSKTADIIIVASMILNQCMQSWHLPAIQTTYQNNTKTTNTNEL